MTKTSIVLYNFQDFFLSEPSCQNLLGQQLAYMITITKCQDEKIPSIQANSIFKEIMEKINKYGVSSDLIKKRQYNFFPIKNFKNETLFEFNDDQIANFKNFEINHRMESFNSDVLKFFEYLYKNEKQIPKTIIHTTCTGYLSPSPAQTFLSRYNHFYTQVIHAYHMGCYAAIPSVNIAAGIISASHNTFAELNDAVDVVHSEIASVHVDINNSSPGNIINSTLFGDGFIKYSVTTKFNFRKKNTNGFKLLAIETMQIKNSLHEMTWVPGPSQFEMYLSKNIPLLIGENIEHFLEKLCYQIGINFEKEKNNLCYAIHPGGPKILNFIQKTLKLDENKIDFSINILKKLGNMSSATLPYIWKEIIESKSVDLGQKVISVAFGPGLTATGIIFEKV